MPACVQLTQTTSAPLVGNVAPDFTAQAVFDQEFQEISLSSYRGKARVPSPDCIFPTARLCVNACDIRPPV